MADPPTDCQGVDAAGNQGRNVTMPQTVERYARQLVSQYEFAPIKLDGFSRFSSATIPVIPGEAENWTQCQMDVSETIRLCSNETPESASAQSAINSAPPLVYLR